LDPELLQSRIEAKKEALTRQKKTCSIEDIIKETTQSLKVDYLLSRIDSPSEY